eukprot:gene29905-17975_t
MIFDSIRNSASYETCCMRIFSSLMDRAKDDAVRYADERHVLGFFQKNLAYTVQSGFKHFLSDDDTIGSSYTDTGCDVLMDVCNHVARIVYTRPHILHDGKGLSPVEAAEIQKILSQEIMASLQNILTTTTLQKHMSMISEASENCEEDAIEEVDDEELIRIDEEHSHRMRAKVERQCLEEILG